MKWNPKALRTQADFIRRFLFWPIIFFAVSLTLSAVAYGVFLIHLDERLTVLEEQKRQLSQLQRQVKQLKSDIKLYQEHIGSLKLLQEQGFNRTLNRVIWTDKLNRYSQRWLINGLSLQFYPEKSLKKNDLKRLPLDSPVIFSSKVTLTARIQAESDLFQLIDYIRKDLDSTLWVERCEINRSAKTGVALELNIQQGNLMIRCDLHVFRAHPGQFNPAQWR